MRSREYRNQILRSHLPRSRARQRSRVRGEAKPVLYSPGGPDAPTPPREVHKRLSHTKMILTNCAACAAPLAHNAPRCVRVLREYLSGHER